MLGKHVTHAAVFLVCCLADLMNAAGPHFLTDYLAAYRSAQRRQRLDEWRKQHKFQLKLQDKQLKRKSPLKRISPHAPSNPLPAPLKDVDFVVRAATATTTATSAMLEKGAEVVVVSAEVFSPYMDMINRNSCCKTS